MGYPVRGKRLHYKNFKTPKFTNNFYLVLETFKITVYLTDFGIVDHFSSVYYFKEDVLGVYFIRYTSSWDEESYYCRSE